MRRLALLLLASFACVGPPILEGRPCDESRRCPPPLTCGADDRCHASLADGGFRDTDGGVSRDAGATTMITIDPDPIALASGRTVRLTATDGARDVSALVTWRVLNPNVARIDDDVLTALAAGTTIIEAELDGVVGVAMLEVHPPLVDGIATFSTHNLVLWSDGVVTGWGLAEQGQLGDAAGDHVATATTIDIDADAIWTGGSTTFFRARDGSVWGLGTNAAGELGSGALGDERTTTPQRVVTSGGDPLTNVDDVRCGVDFCIALVDDGDVYTWGGDTFGDLGLGHTQSTPTPRATRIEALADVTAIAAGAYHGVALHSDGRVSTWGNDEFGQQGVGTRAQHRFAPVLVTNGDGTAPLEDVEEIRAGWGHTVARLSNGTLRTWGSNGSGQLGDGTFTDRSRAIEVIREDGLGPLVGVVAISAGFRFTLAATFDGRLLAWGANDRAQLGGGTDVGTGSLPQLVLESPDGEAWRDFETFVAGGDHTLVRGKDGAIYTFGSNENAEQGKGTVGLEGDSLVPTRVTPLGR